MKKIVFIFALASFLYQGSAQEEKKWSWGGGFGLGGNPVYFYSGDEMANAQFRMKNFASGILFLSVREDLNRHWAWMGSLEFRNTGFEYVLLNQSEYSLKKPEAGQIIRHEQVLLQVPLMALYKTLPDCKNKRWIFGAGIVPVFSGAQELKTSRDIEKAGSSNVVFTATSQFSGYTLCFGRFMIGREKIFRNGNYFHWGLEHVFVKQNVGTSTIEYSVAGNNYSHTFKNPGVYTGLFFRYLFATHKTYIHKS